MVKKLNYYKSRERGKELKVPHHTSTTVVRDGNLPQLALNNGYLPLFPTISKLLKLFREQVTLFTFYRYTYLTLTLLS